MFEISVQSLKEVERLLTDEFTKGLKSEEDNVEVKMLVTHVHKMHEGTEEGEFLIVDLGVHRLRVLHISKSFSGNNTLVSSMKFWRGSNFVDRAFLNAVLRLIVADACDYRIRTIRHHGISRCQRGNL